MQQSSMFKGINVVSISVTNLDKAREFYANTLGFGNRLQMVSNTPSE